MSENKHYGFADKAWQVVVGCSPSMSCAPRCWARKTVARVVECQGDKGRDLFQVALTPDRQKWSGKVVLDEARLLDPMKWRKTAIIATGFHGDWARLDRYDQLEVLRVMDMARQHTFMPLTKCPSSLVMFSEDCIVLDNVNLGCSVMNQTEANSMRGTMAKLAAMGWKAHVWYEPAIGPVDWKGWEFLTGIIAGGESGAGSRPSHPNWFRATRDWCVVNGVAFTFKQHGDWIAINDYDCFTMGVDSGRYEHQFTWRTGHRNDAELPISCYRVGKALAGCLLDGREWKEFPKEAI